MDLERLTYMANQIARNFAPQGEAGAIEATFEHVRDYWDPRMKAALAADPSGLEPIAAAALARLKR